MAEIACGSDKNCTVDMDTDIKKINSDYLNRRYTESWIGALVAFILLGGLFVCKIYF